MKQAVADLDCDPPRAMRPALAAGLKATLQLLQTAPTPTSGTSWRSSAPVQQRPRAEALGLSVSAEAEGVAAPGQSSTCASRPSVSPRAAPWRPGQPGPPPPLPCDLVTNRPARSPLLRHDPRRRPSTRPYFSRPDIEQPYYDLADPKLLGESLPPYPLAGWPSSAYNDVTIRLGQIVQTTRRVTGLGTVSEPLAVAPAVSVAISPRAGVVPLDAKSFPVSVSHARTWNARPARSASKSPQAGPSTPASFPLDAPSTTFTVTPPPSPSAPTGSPPSPSTAAVNIAKGTRSPAIPASAPTSSTAMPRLKTSGVNVTIAPGLKVAYVAGTGDEVPAALENLGVKVAFLAAADLAAGDLSRFDAILLGVRAYAARPT